MIGWAMLTGAFAQDPVATGSVQQLHTSLDSQRTVWTDDASVVRSGTVQARALASYAARPVEIDRGPAGLGVVRSAWQVDVSAAVTVQRARFGVVVPVLFGVTSDLVGVSSAGLSDLAVDAKYTVLDPETRPLGLAAVARIGIPVGAAGITGLSSRGSWLEATAVLEGAAGPLQVMTNLGLRVGAPASVDGVVVRDQLVGRLALALPVAADRAGAAVEVASRVGVTSPLAGTTPVEAGLTGWFRLSDRLAVRAGAGRFVVDGLGASSGRLLLGLTSHPTLRANVTATPATVPLEERAAALSEDRDGDGVVDAHDRCLRETEDVDGYRDEDGCPDDVQLGVRILTRDGAIAHGAFAWLRCSGEPVRLMPDEVLEVPEGSCVIDAAGVGWSAQRAMRYVDNGPPVEWTVQLEPTQPMARLVLSVTAVDGQPLEEALWSVGQVYGRVTDGKVEMALPVGTYPVRVKARDTLVDEQVVEVGRKGASVRVTLERR